MNTGEMTKAGSATLLGWRTTPFIIGTYYTPGQTITPSTSHTMYAAWSIPVYQAYIVDVKLWVDKTYRDKYPDWASQAAAVAEVAKYPFYQTYNITMNFSPPTAMTTGKHLCPYAPWTCNKNNPECGELCANHHTNGYNILQYVKDNKDLNFGMNTLFMYGTVSCVKQAHENNANGVAQYPWDGGASIAESREINAWPYIRIVQHEWSHNFGAFHTLEDPAETPCTSMCVMDQKNGWHGERRSVPDVWCDRCKVLMAPYLGAHSP